MRCYVYTGNNYSHRNSITKGVKNNFEAIQGEHSEDSLQKTAVFGTSHIIRKVLQSETATLSGGDRRWFKGISTGEKRPVTRKKEKKKKVIIIIIIIIIIKR